MSPAGALDNIYENVKLFYISIEIEEDKNSVAC